MRINALLNAYAPEAVKKFVAAQERSWIAATVLVWQLDLGRAREDTRGRPQFPARLTSGSASIHPYARSLPERPARCGLLKGYPTLDPGNIETAGAAESGDPG